MFSIRQERPDRAPMEEKKQSKPGMEILNVLQVYNPAPYIIICLSCMLMDLQQSTMQ